VIGLTSPVRKILMPEKKSMINSAIPGENKETLPGHLNDLFDRTKTDL
jgi:hypothetical protein